MMIRNRFCSIWLAIMGVSLSGLVGSGLAAQSGASDPSYYKSYHSVPKDTVSETVYQGWKQYMLNCARCHGDYGVGTSFAPALTESVKADGTIPTPELFMTTVCAGRLDKGMPAWCALGLEINAITQIYAYLKDRSDGRIGLGRPAVRPDPTRAAGGS